MIEIKIKYLQNKDGEKQKEIKQIEVGDWIDLAVNEDIEMTMLDFLLLPLGVAMELPKGYEAHMIPRSSTFKKHGIIQANSMGLIDNSYCGDTDEWKFPAICLSPTGTSIKKGSRICQFRIMKTMDCEVGGIKLIKVGHLGNADRGGIGSTDSIQEHCCFSND